MVDRIVCLTNNNNKKKCLYSAIQKAINKLNNTVLQKRLSEQVSFEMGFEEVRVYLGTSVAGREFQRVGALKAKVLLPYVFGVK